MRVLGVERSDVVRGLGRRDGLEQGVENPLPQPYPS